MDDGPLSDDELANLALAADPDAPLGADAVPWSGDDRPTGPLPDWYMPVPAAGGRRIGRGRRFLAWVIVAGTLAVPAAGLCNTFGQLVIA